MEILGLTNHFVKSELQIVHAKLSRKFSGGKGIGEGKLFLPNPKSKFAIEVIMDEDRLGSPKL